MSSKKKAAGAASSKTRQKRQQDAPATAGDLDSLVSAIVHIHQQTQEFAAKAVNVALTLRNCLIGRRIEVYERQGADRATYGGKLMDTLAKRLVKQGWERCDRRELYRFRQFYLAYPKIVESLTTQSRLRSELSPLLALVPSIPARIRESVTAKSLEAPHPVQACCRGEPLHLTKRAVHRDTSGLFACQP